MVAEPSEILIPIYNIQSAKSRFYVGLKGQRSFKMHFRESLQICIVVSILYISSATPSFSADNQLDSPSGVVDVIWDQVPSQKQLDNLYPTKALTQKVSGTATIKCDIAADGTLANCALTEENPASYGFGYASIRASVFYKARMGNDLVKDVQNRMSSISIPFHWSPP